MDLFLLGISHKTAPVLIRQRYSLSKDKIKESLLKLSCNKMIAECVILSTCNRTESYIVTTLVDLAKEYLYKELEIIYEDKGLFYLMKDKDVVRHILRVASGLESQLIGETQILGQVKDAYLMAKELGMTGRYLNRLFQKALEVGGDIRKKTKISDGNLSIGSVAIRLIENLLGRLNERKILIIGTGKIARLVTIYLAKRGISGVFVANRTYERALRLSREIGGKAVRFESLKDNIKDIDIIITATASTNFILESEVIKEVMESRKRPLFIIDLAVPHDADPRIKGISNVVLYNLDDLSSIIEENFKKRMIEAKKAEGIIEKEVERFLRHLSPSLLVQGQVG